MLKSLVSILLIALAALPATAQQTDMQGYSPKVSSYGNYYNQLRADVQHIPHRYSLTQGNTTDSTPQLFVWSTTSGDSLVLFVNGRYIIIQPGDGDSTNSVFTRGTYTTVTTRGDTVTYDVDTGALHALFLMVTDTTKYVTPTQLATKLSSISTSNSVAGAGTPASPVQLVGDQNAPGNSMYYGTNPSGGKGYYPLPSGVAAGNPANLIGLTPNNGIASTYKRSDATDALSQAIAPTWTGQHTFSLAPIFTPLTGYLYANGSSALTASTTIPYANITGGPGVFGTTTNGLVPAPGSATGKVLDDFGAWVTNGSGSSQIYAKTPMSVLGTDTAVADTNAQHPIALVTYNQVPLYNVMRFGAHRDSTYNNSAAFQMAIDTCYYHGGGTVIIPAGVWKAEINLTNRASVNIRGEGKGTVFKPVAAGDTVIKDYNTFFPVFRYPINSYAGEYGSGDLSNFMIEGSNIASVGIYRQYNYWFTYDHLWIDSCTNVGIYLKGALTGTVANSTIKYCGTNILLDTINLTGGLVAPNLLTLEDIHSYWAPQWGFKVLNSQGLVKFVNIDCSDNGTTHNPNTGGFYVGTAASPDINVEWDNVWFEANKGTLIYCQSPSGAAECAYNMKHILAVNNPNASQGLYASASSIPAYFSIESTYLAGDSVDVIIGSGTHIVNNGGFVYGTTNATAGTAWNYIKDNSVYDLPFLRGNSGAPFISATGTGAGASGATASLSGWSSSLGGDVTVNVTASAAANSPIVTVGYNLAWVKVGITGHVTGANTLAQNLGGDAMPILTGTGTFSYPLLTSGKIPLDPGTYIFHISIFGQ